MTSCRIPFTRVHLTGRELEYMREVMESNQFAGDGPFTRKCERWLEGATGAARVLLTHSGTTALDMAAILSGVGEGDEVMMPSFTFSSTANAFVMRGARPVFVDIDPRTLNIDPARVAAAVTPRTRAIVPRPATGDVSRGNGHLYYVLLPSTEERTAVIDALRAKGIYAVFHYVPLHSARAGLRYGRVAPALRAPVKVPTVWPLRG